MKSLKHTKPQKLALISSLLLMSAQASAATIGAGFGMAPEFSGSDDNTIIPMASFKVETPIGILSNEQLGVQLDIIKSESVDTGPILRINTGRNDSVTDAEVAALPEIEAGLEAGWFIGSGVALAAFGLTSNAIIIGRLSAVTGLGDGHEGSLISGSVGLVMPVTEKMRFIPSVSFNYADEKYNQAFYGVDADNATAGLGAFTAEAGVESAQFAIVGIRTINEKWSVTGIGAYNALQGDAAESTIAKRGSDTSLFAGFTLNYTF